MVPASRGDAACCSNVCELKWLREQVKAKDERIERLSRKKGPVKCLGRVHWATCVQEWYLKETFDAKRRASELRKLGYEVRATAIGEMPVETADDIEMVKVTILTAWHPEQGPLAPAPGLFVDGIRPPGNGRRR